MISVVVRSLYVRPELAQPGTQGKDLSYRRSQKGQGEGEVAGCRSENVTMMSLSLACVLGAARKPLLSPGVVLPHTQLILLEEGEMSIESVQGLLALLFTGLIENLPELVAITITSLQESG